MKMKRMMSFIAIIGIITTLFVGCGSKSETPAAADKTGKATASTDEVKKVRVAVANDFSPFAYLDEQGNYIGYEVDVLKKVDELLPKYEFEYQTVSDQFVALTSNKVDLIAHQWESNPKRQETYLFAKELVTNWAAYIITKTGEPKLQTYADLEGKAVSTFQGSNDAYQLESYNKEHKDAIKLEYLSPDFSVVLSKLDSGAINAFLLPLSYLDSIETNYNVKLQTSDQPAYYSGTFFIYRKDDADETTLQEAVDGALKSLREDGTLSALSKQWLGEDYSGIPEAK